MRHLTYIILFLLAGAAALLAVPGQSSAQQSRVIQLAGHKSVPTVGTPASGEITVTVSNDSLIVSGSFKKLLGQYHSGGVFVGEEDENGNRLFLLEVSLNEQKTGGTFEEEKNRFFLRDIHKQYLAEGEFYISIASYEKPRGEIRAQIPAIKNLDQ